MHSDFPRGRALFRAALVIAAGLVLWWLGHVLLESVWTLARMDPGSPVPRIANLMLIPVAFAAAWLGLRWAERRASDDGGPPS